jgi:hypothetical protein
MLMMLAVTQYDRDGIGEGEIGRMVGPFKYSVGGCIWGKASKLG